MSGLLPMASSHREYWQNVFAGADCTSDVPESRWRLDDYYSADPSTPDKTYSRRGAFVPDIEFNPMEFGLPPNQLGVTSTMQLLSLGVARDVLVDAGATGSDWYDPVRTGVVLGAGGAVPLAHQLQSRISTPVLKEVALSCGLSEEMAEEMTGKFVKAYAPWEENTFPGMLINVVAGRVANRLGLGGMNCTVDAACSASLASVRIAVAELVDGRADMMITGGVDTETSIFMYMCFSKVGALSHSDKISPFSNTADGTMLGEGLGMLALKRLADAERDGNRIYAVIRGVGSSSDGRANSIYAPSAGGQRVALDRAYADAECSPASVELFELHGTGTKVGDRTELTALGELLRGVGDERHVAALGSVKSQIGHTKGTAGAAGLMKLAFALHQKVLPGTINVEAPNSAVDFVDAPYYINTRTRPWILDPKRPTRRAGVSAMGFGGTNFHVVLEEYTSDRTGLRMLHRTPMAYLWHAPDNAGLLELLRTGVPGTDGGEIPAGHARVGFVAVDDEQAAALREVAIEQLSRAGDVEAWSHPKGVFYRRRALENLRVGALFAGQGGQYLNMGFEAVLNNPVLGQAFDTANRGFADAEVRLSRVVFPPPTFDADLRKRQESDLVRTEYAQPAIGALSVGQFSYLTELGLTCSACSGHSFGELTALWAAGSLSEPDYFRLAAARAAAMAPAEGVDAGQMAAIRGTREQVTELLSEFPEVVVCNHNSPEQVVVGGGTHDITRLIDQCGEKDIKARLLPMDAAYHTRFVENAAEEFAPVIEQVGVAAPTVPVYANSPGAVYGSDTAANAAILARQLIEPVEFVEVLTKMRAAGITVFVEFGPKQILTQFVRQTLGDDVHAIATDAGPGNDSDVALKRAAVQLAVLGMPLSGINRNTEPEAVKAAPTGMSMTLSAPEYVPEERRAAYQAALNTPPAAAPRGVTAAAPSSLPVPAFTARRDVEAIVGDPVMQAHRIGANVVLPATFGLGWLINVVEQAYPGMYVVEAADFQVHKGIVFDGTPRGDRLTYVETGTPREDRIVVRAAARGETDKGKPIPHYAATLTLATEPVKQPTLAVPPISHGPDDTQAIYRQATLFHGPPLQGIRKVLDRSLEHLVVQCKLADADVAERAYHGRLHSPVLADLLLQAAGILAKDVTGAAGLPLGIGGAEWFAPLPDNEPFILSIDKVRPGPATVTINVTAVAADGSVLQRFTDVLLVSTEGLRVA
jgi:polyketide-type polyunsaturated fatty acid synthase PfaA